ncbi:uncharacterized protein LOC133152288 isoform X3 [Syngnathus typhle]|uniref:uncharacterized protein LOC133152288 isoform X3 n=1 Tax=Syngnathus typhle TaxID=161592 RepID=UPI002A6B80E6|nr:uncharacterized protein LOC133152288 isoform X3 [Syngnathus typhle]
MLLAHAKVSALLLLAAGHDTATALAVERVRYSPVKCAVRGSTVTLRCSFTAIMSVVRVVWCVNHRICQGTTPSVYDSNKPNKNLRFVYLGDHKNNCTLQIRQILSEDNTTFRFRMEAGNEKGHFTGQAGVTVSVLDAEPMRVQSSAPGPMRVGAAVTLSCTSSCSFHDLDVRWHKDGQPLPESGPTLRLTAERSANYTCNLALLPNTMSPPFRLNVAELRTGGHFVLTLSVSLGLLMALLLTVAIVLFLNKRRKRRQASPHDGKRVNKERETCEQVYANTQPGGDRGGPDAEEAGRSADEVSYAAVQFKAKAVNRPVETKEDVVYASIARLSP